MTKKITCLVFSCLLLICLEVAGQNSVGIGTPTPNPKAVLELVSPGNNQGLIVPRLTTSQRTAGSFMSTLTTGENGLLVFDSDDQKFYYWQNGQWLPIRSGSDVALTAGTGINITGSTISAIADGDGNSTNEIQDLTLTGNTLTITNNASATSIDLSPYAGTNTDDQDLQNVLGKGNNANNIKITNLGAPTIGTDAATKQYVDGLTGGNNLITSINNVSTTGLINTGRIAAGTSGQFLTTVGSTPTWSTISSLPPSGTAGGDLTGTYPNPTIATGKVTSTAIADATIVNADILNVDATKITTGTLPVTRGGSGITSVVPGAIAFGGATNFAFTAAGTSGQLLQSNGSGTPTWINPPAASGTAGGDLTGSYPNPTIATGKVTSAAIADGVVASIDITDGTITTTDISDNTIANIDIANVDASKITTGTLPVTRGGSGITAVVPGAIAYGGATNFAFTAAGTTGQLLQSNGAGIPTWINPPAASGTAGGDLTGTYPNPTIGTDKVTSATILDGAVASIDIADGTITTVDISDNTIANIDIANVDASKITTGTMPVARGGSGITAVVPGAIAYGGATNFAFTAAGTAGQLLQSNGSGVPTWITPPAASGTAGGDLTGSFPNPTIATGKVTSTAILDATILTADIADNAITSIKILDGVVSSVDITDNTIATADIAANAITTGKIAPSGTINHVLTTTAAGTTVAWAALPAFGFGSVTSIVAGTGLTGGPITTTGTLSIAAGGITATELAANAVTDVKVANVAPGKLTQSGAATGDVLKWGGTAWAPAAGSSGTVTSVAAGTGLTGGPITSTGTLSIAAGGVGSTELAANAVTDVKIATGITASKITASGTVAQVLTTTGVGTTGWATVVDNSVTNEIQTLSIAGSNLTLSNGGGTVGIPTNTAGTGIAITTGVISNTGDLSATNELQDLKSVLSRGTDANASDIVNVKSLGIGTANPKTNLALIGSHSVSFTVSATSYTVKPDDYLLIIDGDGTDLTLPLAKDIPGRVLIIRTPNASKGIDVVAASGDKIDGFLKVPLIDLDGSVNAITIVSDGNTGWWIINKSRR